MSHVNLMTDTAIANLPSDGLRTILRGILASNPEITPVFEKHVKTYLERDSDLMSESNTPTRLEKSIALSRVMLGCGIWAQSLELMRKVLLSASQLFDVPADLLNSIDGDLIQAVTAIEKIQSTRILNDEELHVVEELYQALLSYRASQTAQDRSWNLDRSFKAIAHLTGHAVEGDDKSGPVISSTNKIPMTNRHNIETFNLHGRKLPRLFTGLWQLSSPSWGIASHSQMSEQFHQYSDSGFTAYDMADHYGDAEVLFGEFRSRYGHREDLFASTKLCIFQPVEVTPQYIRDNVSERCRRLNSERVDLLQFHWQFYDDKQYINALQLLQDDARVSLVGLCNFDTKRMKEILSAGIKIVSNQVQFSLIDSRPTVRMGSVCEARKVKLLTYGTLCGGFIAEKWLGKAEPEQYSDGITPSQRKYFEMIRIWGGWKLFQELLQTLQTIAVKHNVSISNVATRWVLDFPYVGAVIVGARMGVAEHIEDNLRVYGWKLNTEDHSIINKVLERSRRDDIYTRLGDCGGEYRL